MRSRTKAREISLQLLYEYDATREMPDERISSFLNEFTDKAEAREYARKIVAGVIENYNEIDDFIKQFAEHWTVARMPIVDRNILRIGVLELLFEKDVPAKVVINEAVELAKRFGSADSGRFINAILDRTHKEQQKQTDTKQH